MQISQCTYNTKDQLPEMHHKWRRSQKKDITTTNEWHNPGEKNDIAWPYILRTTEAQKESSDTNQTEKRAVGRDVKKMDRLPWQRPKTSGLSIYGRREGRKTEMDSQGNSQTLRTTEGCHREISDWTQPKDDNMTRHRARYHKAEKRDLQVCITTENSQHIQ